MAVQDLKRQLQFIQQLSIQQVCTLGNCIIYTLRQPAPFETGCVQCHTGQAVSVENGKKNTVLINAGFERKKDKKKERIGRTSHKVVGAAEDRTASCRQRSG